MLKIFTIGVYGSTEETFFKKLTENGVEVFCDIRMRRGVRGAQYRYVNSKYLQAKLAELGIAYRYVKELAPTSEIRQKQKDADAANGETKKQRVKLGEVFASEYQTQILGEFDMEAFADSLRREGVGSVALFCVEEHAPACHRSLAAAALAEKTQGEIINL